MIKPTSKYGFITKKSFIVLFSYFFLTTAFILSITLFPMYYLLNDRMEKDLFSSNKLLLQQIKINVDSMLRQIDEDSIKIIGNIQLQKITSGTYNGDNEMYYSDILKLAQLLNDERSANKYIYSIYMYLLDTDVVLSNGNFYNKRYFNDKAFIQNAINSKDMSGWDGPRNISAEPNVTSAVSNGNVISFYRKYSLNPLYNSNTKAILVINIDSRDFKKPVTSFSNNHDLQFYMTNDKGDIIASYNGGISDNIVLGGLDTGKFVNRTPYWEQELDGEDFLISYEMSGFNDWRYIIVLPKEAALSSLIQVKRIVQIIVLVCCFFGLALSMFLSKKYYNPIEKLIREISGYNMNSDSENKSLNDDFKLIDGTIKSLIKENTDNKEIIESNLNIIKDKFVIDRLNFVTETKNNIYQDTFRYKKYFVICLEIDCPEKSLEHASEADGPMIIHNTEKICKECFEAAKESYTTLVVKVCDDLVSIIINYNDEVYPVIHEQLLKLQNSIISSINIACTIGMGGIYEDEKKISASYREALAAIKYKAFFGHNSIIDYNYINEHLYSDFDEAELLHKKNLLIKCIRVKDHDGMMGVIAEIGVILHEVDVNHFERIKFVFISIFHDIMKLIYNTNENEFMLMDELFNIYTKVKNASCIKDLQKLLEEKSLSILEFVIEKSNKAGNEMNENIISYINDNYHRNFSIENLAEKVRLHPVYLGKLIKRLTGKTYPQLITQLRIEKAIELINSKNCSMKEVYEKLGYVNRQSFIRAFKSYTGATPTEYLQAKVKNELSMRNDNVF